ncbi:MAG: rhomboid family intramembrane serine protease [Segetibacter sp.]
MKPGETKKILKNNYCLHYKKAKRRVSYEELQFAANALKTETIRQIRSGNRIASERMTFGFKDHEVTFMLIAINLLVYAVMILKGVDYVNPAVKDIIGWGGNLKFNVSGGEWWRLITAVFVHIGIFPMLVNIIGLYFIGLMVEPILGKFKFLIAYLCTGVIAGLASILLG